MKIDLEKVKFPVGVGFDEMRIRCKPGTEYVVEIRCFSRGELVGHWRDPDWTGDEGSLAQ